ncbi:MAG: hypothetical protein AABZ84_02840 [Pseudomonadota bacterium]
MQTTTSGATFDSSAHRALDIRSDSAENWVAALPLANLGETCRLIFASLTQMNDIDASAAQRFKSLEPLRAPVHYLRDALRRRYTGIAFPLPEKAHRVAQLLREIQLEIAEGYQRVATQILAQNGLRQDMDTLITALHRALYYHGQALLTSYELYEEIGGQRWQEIYTLYLEAERKALHLGAVKDTFKEGDNHTSVSDMFKHILLLALADPHRLTQHEMSTAYSMLEKWAGQCQLYSATDFNEPPGVFVVNLSSDAPPTYLVYSPTQPHAATRLLDTTALSHSLRGLLAQANQEVSLASARGSDVKEISLSRELLKRLLLSWSYTSKRGFSRTPQSNTLAVTFGLSASHEAVNSRLIHAGRSPQARNNPKITCQIINESATGTCLRWETGDPARARVGELITVYPGDGGDTAGIAVIRWLKCHDNGSVDFGIQMLVPAATPVTIRLSDAAEVDRDYLKALLLPALPPAETSETLLTPAFLYRPGDIVSVNTGQGEQRYRLVRAVENTQAYARFQFAPLTESLEEPVAEISEPVRRKDFDSVWAGL